MKNISALSRGTQLLAAAGVLLLIDTFLAWQSVDLGVVDFSRNAWHGFWGVLLGLMLIALLAWVGARIAGIELPMEVPDGLITVALGALIFLFALIKGLSDDYSTFWSWIGIILAAGVAAGAWLRFQESGGTVDALRASIPTRQSDTSPPASSSTSPPTAPAPPAEPTSPASPPPPPASSSPAPPDSPPPSATDQT